MKQIILMVLFTLGFLLAFGRLCQAAIREVGSGKAYSTIQAGINNAQPGDVVNIQAGDYRSENRIKTVRAGTNSTSGSITIQANAPEAVRIAAISVNHDYIKVQGLTIEKSSGWGTAGLMLNAGNCVISHNNITGAGVFGPTNFAVEVHGDDNIIVHNTIDGNSVSSISFFIAFSVNGTNNVFSNNVIKNILNIERIWDAGGDDALHMSSDGTVIKDNEAYNFVWNGSQTVHPDIFQAVDHGPNTANNWLIENNYFHDMDSQIGINEIGGGEAGGWIIRNNVFANINQRMQLSTKNLKVHNNTFFNVNPAGHVTDQGHHTGCEYKNNIFVGASTNSNAGMIGITNGGGGVIIDSNYYGKADFSGRTQSVINGYGDLHYINGGDPRFLAAYKNCVTSTCDFRLQTNSLLIGQGADLSAAFTKDKDGKLRTAPWDIGAYEYGGPAPAPYCGDKSCDNGETCSTCPGDCIEGCQPVPSCSDCIEAESGTLTSPMAKGNDSGASGGMYIESNTSESGMASYSFSITTPGTYKFTARVFAASGGNDSFYFTVDNNTEDTWDMNPAGDPALFNKWIELDINKRGSGTFDNPQYQPYTVNLSAGTHTLSFRGRESGTKLDWLKPVAVQAATKNGDLNNDNKIDVTDLGILLGNWGATSRPAADLNQDGKVDVTDLGVLLGNWG